MKLFVRVVPFEVLESNHARQRQLQVRLESKPNVDVEEKLTMNVSDTFSYLGAPEEEKSENEKEDRQGDEDEYRQKHDLQVVNGSGRVELKVNEAVSETKIVILNSYAIFKLANYFFGR